MSVVKALIQLTGRGAVQRAWDGWFGPRDEPAGATASGAAARTSGSGGGGLLSPRGAYLLVGAIVAAYTLVDALSKAQEIGWRMGAPGNLWEPLLWNTTSGAVVLALLPLGRRAAVLARTGQGRWLAVGLASVGLALVFAAVHVLLMFPLRQLAYAVAGWDYTIRWSQAQIVYEARKDLVSFAIIAVMFWLAERPAAVPAPLPSPSSAPPELWLRDGRMNMLIDAREVVSVTSAGNYVEYVLTGGRRHLIRATLQAEAERLAAFGLVRVHRTRLVNLKRIVALEWGPSGDFELKLDTGEVVAGSRRFKDAVAGLGPGRA
jgi:hypothetical protein